MESCKSSASNKKLSVPKTPRFMFTIMKDVQLLESALSINPFQLGKGKWEEVIHDLRLKYGYSVTARTARERVENLINKFKKEELVYRTGQEEEQSRRGILLAEIINIIESEQTTINDISANEEMVPQNFQTQRQDERQIADEERDAALKRKYIDEPSGPNLFRKKRNKEEDLVKLKLVHDIEMENKKFEFEKEVKREQLAIEEKRIQVELAREQRLAAEQGPHQELMSTVQQTLKIVNQILLNK